MKYYAVFLLLMSVFLFVLMAYDKYCAKKGRSRIPERTLFALGILGGAVGGLAAMQAFRHKTRHISFYIVFALGVTLQAVLAFVIFFNIQ